MQFGYMSEVHKTIHVLILIGRDSLYITSIQPVMATLLIYVTLSAKTCIIHASMYIEKKRNLLLCVKLRMLLENIY